MGPETNLREREVVEVGRVWHTEVGQPLLITFYLTELDGCISCIGYALRTFRVVTESDEESPYSAWAEVPLDVREANPSVEVDLADPFEMNATMVKAVPFYRLVTEAKRQYAREVGATPSTSSRANKEAGSPLKQVADLYAFRCGQGSPTPTRDVADHLRRSYSTVAKQVMRCREVGLLGRTSRGRRGALVHKVSTAAAGASITASPAKLERADKPSEADEAEGDTP